MHKKHRVQVMLSEIQYNRFFEMANEMGNTPSELSRLIFDKYYIDVFTKNKFGYAGTAIAKKRLDKENKVIDRENTIASIKSKTDEELTAYFQETGYFPADGPWDENPLYDRQHRMVTNQDTGVRMYMTFQIEKATGRTTYKRDVYTVDEIIGQLIKEDKI